MKKSRHMCPICFGSLLQPVIQIAQVPILNNELWNTQEQALNAPRGDLLITYCLRCNHVFNRAFDAARISYSPSYENSLYGSPLFQRYAERLASQLSRNFELERKKILEIGCGQGDFLRQLCASTGSEGLGFDPSIRPASIRNTHGMNVTLIPEHFSPSKNDYQADLYIARHVIEHLQRPVWFLRELRRSVQPDKVAALFLEVPNGNFMLAKGGIWDLIYEHHSYFDSRSLRWLLRQADFVSLSLYPAFGGQYLCVEARTDSPDLQPLEEVEQDRFLTEITPDLARSFERTFHQKLNHWEGQINRFKMENLTAVLWGAGSKGVSFLNFTRSSGIIEYAVDINPKKQGMFVAGAGQRIISPAELREKNPDVVIVMNAQYEEEIRQTLAQLELAPQLMFA